MQEEMALARAPEIVNRIAVNLLGPTLLEHGSDEQRDRYLGRILTAEDIWCQLFSEPEAGSDLGSMRTAARRERGGWRVTGQKIWTSNADHADYGILLAKTGDAAHRRPPIGFFLVDMRQRGITVRPLRQMTGESDFCEVFLDDVRVEDNGIVGDPEDGWSVLQSTIGFERSISPRQLIVHSILMDELLAQARAKRMSRAIRQRLARGYAELRLYRLLLYRLLSDLEAGMPLGASGSVLKLFWSEMAQRMHETSMDMMGASSVTTPSVRQRNYLYYRACTIFAGTSEIQRNTIAEQILGLPREPRPVPARPAR